MRLNSKRLVIGVMLLVPFFASGKTRPKSKKTASSVKALRKACKKDLKRHCNDNQVSAGQQLVCLAKHERELSPDCKPVAAGVAALILPELKKKKAAKNKRRSSLKRLVKHVRKHGTRSVDNMTTFTRRALVTADKNGVGKQLGIEGLVGASKDVVRLKKCLEASKSLAELRRELE
ncbi:MAG: cysteine rich repeat-containing protein, partial [Bradymonadia bacterium]